MFLYKFIQTIDPIICFRHREKKKQAYLCSIWILTFMIYASYHIARKPISVVKNVLNENCTTVDNTTIHNDTYWCDWKPFNTDHSGTDIGAVESANLFAYSFGMFFSGWIAERSNLNVFLCLGMVFSGIFTSAFGFGYVFNIHSFRYYLIIQILSGLSLSTGWPAVVTIMGNWFGKSKRGLIMGIWNSHTSVGNIIGTLIAGQFLESGWGMSFIVPGCIIGGLGIFTLFFLVPDPKIIGLHNDDEETLEETSSDLDTEQQTRLLDTTEAVVDVEDTTIDMPEKEVEGSIEKPISLLGALKIPGVAEFSLSLFFSKLVSYTFLFWLPHFIFDTGDSNADQSANMSTFFDVGGILGGIMAGQINDMFNLPATTVAVMLILAIPVMFIYQLTAATMGTIGSIFLLIFLGFLVNGPYSLITTAVSADLGTHHSLKGNAKALSTVASVIDGTGSLGAAIGPLIAGTLTNNGNWSAVFYMMMISNVFSLLFVIRIIVKEVKTAIHHLTVRQNCI